VLALDGGAGVWLDELRTEAPSRLRVIAQRRGPLDARIAGAFTDATAACAGSCAFLIGMDTPQLTAEMLVDAVDALVATDTSAVLGLAEDGGWWGLGLRQPEPSLILGLPTSTPHTGQDQLSRLAAARVRVKPLPPLRDVDTAADADHVAALAPDGQFAAALGRLSGKGISAHA
jgi:glycosyltransferase A (GT-A) superfamily protein (DUF2064 family)